MEHRVCLDDCDMLRKSRSPNGALKIYILKFTMHGKMCKFSH